MLKELYDLGKNNKKHTVSAERAHDILSNSILADKWDEKLILTVPRIKAFFQLTPSKMIETLNTNEINNDDVKLVTLNIVRDERDANAVELITDTDCLNTQS